MGNYKMIAINDNEVSQACEMCGRESYIRLTDEELGAFKDYLMGGLLIQECLPTLNKCEREFLKSGCCIKCQELLFGNGYTKRFISEKYSPFSSRNNFQIACYNFVKNFYGKDIVI